MHESESGGTQRALRLCQSDLLRYIIQHRREHRDVCLSIVIGRKCAGKNDGPNGALKVRTWRVNNLFKQYSRPAGIPDIRHSKASDGINATFMPASHNLTNQQ